MEGLRKRGARNPVENAMQLKEKRSRTQEAKDIRRAQKEAGGAHTDRSSSSTPVKLGGGRGAPAGRRPDPPLEKGEVIDFSSLSSSDRTPLTSPSPSPSPDFSAPGTPASHSATPSLLSEADLIPDAMPPQALFHGESSPPLRQCVSGGLTRVLPDDEEMDAEGTIDPGMEYLPPPSRGLVARKKLCVASSHIKCETESEEDEGRQREDASGDPGGQSQGLAVPTGDTGRPERRRSVHADKEGEQDGAGRSGHMMLLSLYEERTLLGRLDACPLALAVTPQAKRLHRKLRLRQAKRQRGLPLLDVDRAVSATLSLVGGVYSTHGAGVDLQRGIMGKYCTTSKEMRVLDRFQVPQSCPLLHFLFVPQFQWCVLQHLPLSQTSNQ